MNYRVTGLGTGVGLALALCFCAATGVRAQEATDADSTGVVNAASHLSLDLDGLRAPWLGRSYTDQRINWSLDSLGILRHGLQKEWRPRFDGASRGVFLYEIIAGDTTGIPIAFDYDTYRLIKADQNTLADWQVAIQTQLRLRDAEKARDLVAISLPFKLPKAVESIVGEGGAGLKVNGFKRINFSGRSQWRDGPQVSLAQSQSKFPSLDMEQITQMTITGKIGSKIEVKVDQDSRRITDLGNRIQIRYRGYDDEIIQTIEAGNTNLSLPNTQFVGYSQRVQGLFGVKTTAKIGHLNLTAIASQEKGSTEGATFSAGARGEQTFLRDDGYLRYRYFWLFDPFTDTLFSRYAADDSAQIIKFELYKTVTTENRQTAPLALCLPRIPQSLTIADVRGLPPDSVLDLNQRIVPLERVEEEDYYLERNQFWITLSDNTPINEATLLACYMIIQTSSGVDTLGEIRADTTARTDSVSLLLTLIKSDQNYTPNHPTWILEWKNVYDLGARDISVEGLQVDVYKGRRGTERQEGQNLNNLDGTPYLEIFGLDRYATDGTAVPDGVIDDSPTILDRRRGHLIFPNSFPFAPRKYPVPVTGDPLNIFGEQASYATNGKELDLEAPGIYNGLQAVNRQEASQYYLAVTTTERRTSYSLGRVNIIEGSEVVRLNGRPLQRGVDYNISYELGQINFISDEVLDPNASVTVDYEYEPFFSVDRKTLFGLRGEYQPSQAFKWGATALFKSEKQPDNQKPRLGEEPSRTLVWDTDMSLRKEAPFLTKLTDALPLVEATAPSNIDFQAEVAQSLPNPNTKGEVFVDDFEASEEIVSLPLFREAWAIASPPSQLTLADRGKLIWYNRFEPYRLTEIYNQDQVPAEDRAQVLSLRLQNAVGPQTWGGVQRSVSAGLQNLSNTQYIEFRVQGDSGTLVFNMGQISEDVNLNGSWDTEDLEQGGFRNGILDEGEDVGLDGLPNAEEPGYDPATNPDPSGDDWFYDDNTRDDYSRINGTEGNRPDPLRGWLPDSEDLNGNNSLDNINSYFEYEIVLSDPNSPFLVQNSEVCNDCSDGETLGPWRTYRIPISDSLIQTATRIVGDPDLLSIQYMRLYITGADAGASPQVNIADMNLVSYRWRDIRIETDVDLGQDFRVAVVNTRENSDYTSPPGVEEVVDRVTLIGQGEQSLLLAFENLQPARILADTLVDTLPFYLDTLGLSPDTTCTSDTVRVGGRIEFIEDSCTVCIEDTCRTFVTRMRDAVDRASVYQTLLASQDYTGYRRLQMFVHGDTSQTAYPEGVIEFFLRFGSDSLNFYEYRSRVFDGWAEANHVDIDFNELTGFKFRAQEDKPAAALRSIDVVSGPYRIRGNPSLSRIEFLEMGVSNRDTTTGAEHSGVIWVDELRLTDVRKDAGWAGRFSVNANFSDFAGITFSYRAQNYAFQSLTTARQNVVNSSSREDFSINARISPHKLLPASWGLQFPVSVNWGRNTNRPYFLTRSDIVVPEDARDEESSVSERKGISIAGRYQKQQGNAVERYLLMPLSTSFSYSQSESRSPTVYRSTSTSYNAQARYNLSIQKPFSVPLLYWTRYLFLPRAFYGTRFTLVPSRFNANGTFQKRQSETLYLAGRPGTTSDNSDFTGQFSLSQTPLTNLTLDYTYNTRRDLREQPWVNSRGDTVSTVNFSLRPGDFKLGIETSFRQSYRASYLNRWIPFLEQRYTWDVGYQETLERQTDGSRSISASRNFQANGGLNWTKLIGPNNPNDRWLTPRIYQPIRKLIRGILNRLDALSIGYGYGKSIRAFGLADTVLVDPITGDSTWRSGRPGMAFLFGFSNKLDDIARTNISAISQRGAEGTTESYTGRSGLGLLGSRITFTYSQRVQKNDNNSSITESRSVTFPSVRVAFTELTRIGFIRAIANSASIEVARDEKEDKQKNVVEGQLTTKSKDKRWSPLIGLSMNLRGNVSTQVKIDHTERTTTRPSLPTAPTNRTEDLGVTASMRYSFSAPQGIRLPLLRGLKLSSTMNVSMAASWTRSRGYQQLTNGAENEVSNRRVFSIAPQAGYSFSQTLTGGLRARWQDTWDEKQQSGTHVRELGFWVEFRF